MKSPRCVAYFALIYTGVRSAPLFVVSITILSNSTLVNVFDGIWLRFSIKLCDLYAFFFLIYFRAGRCDEVNFNIFGRISQDITIQAVMPTETQF